MKFTDDTQFPVFTKSSSYKNQFYWYLNDSTYFQLQDLYLAAFYSKEKYHQEVTFEIQIKKEEFIFENKELLEKTGLLSLFTIATESEQIAVLRETIELLEAHVAQDEVELEATTERERKIYSLEQTILQKEREKNNQAERSEEEIALLKDLLRIYM